MPAAMSAAETPMLSSVEEDRFITVPPLLARAMLDSRAKRERQSRFTAASNCYRIPGRIRGR